MQFVHFSRWSLCAPRFEIQDAQRNPVFLVEGPVCLCRCWSDIEFKVCLLHFLYFAVSVSPVCLYCLILSYFQEEFFPVWKYLLKVNNKDTGTISTLDRYLVIVKLHAESSKWSWMQKLMDHRSLQNPVKHQRWRFFGK